MGVGGCTGSQGTLNGLVWCSSGARIEPKVGFRVSSGSHCGDGNGTGCGVRTVVDRHDLRGGVGMRVPAGSSNRVRLGMQYHS